MSNTRSGRPSGWQKIQDDLKVRFEDLKDMVLVRVGKRRLYPMEALPAPLW
jgi:cell division transport system permease protein